MMLLGYRTMVSPRDFGSLDLGSIPSALVILFAITVYPLIFGIRAIPNEV